jgi:hypothetical protein
MGEEDEAALCEAYTQMGHILQHQKAMRKGPWTPTDKP